MLIVASVVALMYRFVFHDLISRADVLNAFLPSYCFLGRTLAAGHIPAWSASVFGGVPFAADPQYGWMSIPQMALFSALSCGVAMRTLLVLHPLLAGLGIYGFARGEGLSRPASTVGGLVLGLGIAGSNISLSLPFAGSLAWTAITLAGASRFTHASRPSRRILWGLATAGAWGQMANAHLSVGAVTGSGALLAYLAGALWRRAPADHPRSRQAVLWTSLLVVTIPLVNLAILLPRIAYRPETNLSLGYAGVRDLAALIVGKPRPPPIITPATAPTWPLNLAAAPGAHLGAVALGLVLAGLWLRRHRSVVLAFAAYGAICFVLSLHLVAAHVPLSIRSWPPVDFYLHGPQWFAFPMILVVAVLGAFGVTAWTEAASPSERVGMVAPGVLFFFLLPEAFGAHPGQLWLLAVGMVAGGVALWLALRRPGWLGAVPVVLCIELVLNGFIGNRADLPFNPAPGLTAQAHDHLVDPDAYLQAGPIATALGRAGGRYLRVGTLEPDDRLPDVANSLSADDSMLFGTQNVSGYDAVQPLRTWVFLRASQHKTFRYNQTVFSRPVPDVLLDLMDVRWLIASDPFDVEPGDQPVATQGAWTLYRRPESPEHVSLVPSWHISGAGHAFPNEGLAQVVGPGFDPESTVVLDRDPGLGTPGPASPSTGAVRYEPQGVQAARVEVDSSGPAVLLIRNVWENHWHASVDGKPVPLLRADYLVQAVGISPGRHVVMLTYDDPWIGWGLLGSLVVAAAAAAAAVLISRQERASTHVPLGAT